MTIETVALARAFTYNGAKLLDPGAALTPDQVRDFYTNVYPDLANAEVEGPEDKDGVQQYTFRRAVGTKGMVVTLQSTDKVVTLNGVPARIWEGHTDSGVPMHAYITRVAVSEGHDCSSFERDLKAHAAPSAEISAIPMRLVL